MNAAPVIQSLLFFNLHEQSLPAAGFHTEAILDSLLQASTDCIAIKDIIGRYIWINPAGAAFLGKEIEDVLGKTDKDLFSAEAAFKIMTTDQEVMRTGKTQSVQSVLRPLNEEPRMFHAVKCPYKDYSGTIIGVINVVRNLELRDENASLLQPLPQ